MMQTLLTYCGAQGRKNPHQGLPLFYSLFSSSFQRGESISCTHACTTHFFSLPSVYSAASDHLDLTCIVKMWAALPLSSSLSFTPFLFQLSVINVQVLQYLNRGEERVRDELMDGRISTQCPFFKDLLLYSTVSQSFLVGVSVWKPIHVLFCMGKQ